MAWIILCLLFLLTSCASIPKWTVEAAPPIRVNVYVAPDQSQFQWPAYRANYKIKGYATQTGEIWILGTKDTDGRIRPDLWTLGHELAHHLHWADPDRFADPDK